MKDQEMLRLMRVRDESQIPELATVIVSSGTAAEVFEYFADEAITPFLLPLLSEIHAQLRQRDGVAADLKSCEGVFAPWRVARQSLSWDVVEPWLIEELLKCIPGYLRLMNSIYYFWLATESHTREQRERSRAAVYHKCKAEFSSAARNVICSSFDPLFPWVLFHLVFTPDYERQDTVPYGTAQDWAWFGPVLLKTMNLCPSVLVPQTVITANAWETRRREVIAYRFNDEFLNIWFGDQVNTIVRIVADFDLRLVSKLEPNAIGYLTAAKEQAQRRLASSETP
jgi:hypothetical protein